MVDNQGDRAETLGFDHILQRLRQVVAQLETGNLGLEEALRVYEEGVGLARRGHLLLDNAEKRVETLVRDQRDGLIAVPLDPAAGEQADKAPSGRSTGSTGRSKNPPRSGRRDSTNPASRSTRDRPDTPE
ncbi:MAG: exodeoxyribonuclease VII small subunit [Proteobacteria bacterium]|nr:exodeoxyribonuclease VII small subunit [Pseudomonadota bacterium]